MPPKDFDPNLAPYGLIAVQRIISAGENGSDACKGCVLNFGQKYADLCWRARCTPCSRPDESHAVFKWKKKVPVTADD